MKKILSWVVWAASVRAEIEKTGSLYSRVGFVPLNKSYTFYGRSGRLHEKDNGMIAPLTSQEIFEEVQRKKGKLHLGNGNW